MHASFNTGSGSGLGDYPESGLGPGLNGKWLFLMALLTIVSVLHFIIMSICVKTICYI